MEKAKEFGFYDSSSGEINPTPHLEVERPIEAQDQERLNNWLEVVELGGEIENNLFQTFAEDLKTLHNSNINSSLDPSRRAYGVLAVSEVTKLFPDFQTVILDWLKELSRIAALGYRWPQIMIGSIASTIPNNKEAKRYLKSESQIRRAYLQPNPFQWNWHEPTGSKNNLAEEVAAAPYSQYLAQEGKVEDNNRLKNISLLIIKEGKFHSDVDLAALALYMMIDEGDKELESRILETLKDVDQAMIWSTWRQNSSYQGVEMLINYFSEKLPDNFLLEREGKEAEPLEPLDQLKQINNILTNKFHHPAFEFRYISVIQACRIFDKLLKAKGDQVFKTNQEFKVTEDRISQLLNVIEPAELPKYLFIIRSFWSQRQEIPSSKLGMSLANKLKERIIHVSEPAPKNLTEEERKNEEKRELDINFAAVDLIVELNDFGALPVLEEIIKFPDLKIELMEKIKKAIKELQHHSAIPKGALSRAKTESDTSILTSKALSSSGNKEASIPSVQRPVSTIEKYSDQLSGKKHLTEQEQTQEESINVEIKI